MDHGWKDYHGFRFTTREKGREVYLSLTGDTDGRAIFQDRWWWWWWVWVVEAGRRAGRVPRAELAGGAFATHAFLPSLREGEGEGEGEVSLASGWKT